MMNIHAGKERTKLSYKILSAFIAFTFSFTSVVPPSYAQSIASLNLPVPGTMVAPSAAFVPVLLKGMTIHLDNPLQFDFIIDSGNTDFKEDQIKSESERLVKYFLASMTIPKDDLWVNLSPYEKDRIIPDELGRTELGRDMLAQDYILKQLTASLMYPEKELGKEFWDKVYKKAKEKYGTTEIPVDTFNKVWILPETATVYEHGQTVYIVEAKLRVMLDQDYVAGNVGASLVGARDKAGTSPAPTQNNISTSIIREIILPEIEREVNEGQNFAPLRQIYHSLILAKWYKETIKNSLLSKVYVDKKLINGIRLEDGQLKGEDGSIIDSQSSIVDQIYNQYMEAYKKGVFNYIKEDYDRLSNEVIPRKYFSGGEFLRDVEITRANQKVASGITDKPRQVLHMKLTAFKKDKPSSPDIEGMGDGVRGTEAVLQKVSEGFRDVPAGIIGALNEKGQILSVHAGQVVDISFSSASSPVLDIIVGHPWFSMAALSGGLFFLKLYINSRILKRAREVLDNTEQYPVDRIKRAIKIVEKYSMMGGIKDIERLRSIMFDKNAEIRDLAKQSLIRYLRIRRRELLAPVVELERSLRALKSNPTPYSVDDNTPASDTSVSGAWQSYGSMARQYYDAVHEVEAELASIRKQVANIDSELVRLEGKGTAPDSTGQSSSPITPQEARAMIKGKLVSEYHHLISDTHVQLAMAYEGDFEVIYHAGPPESIEIVRAKAVSLSRSSMTPEDDQEKWARLPGVDIIRGGKQGIGSSDEEVIAVVSEDGKTTVGSEKKNIVHEQGLWHMTSHIYLFDQEGRMLLQKRSSTKKSSPNKFQVAVSGHVNMSETPRESASREAREEIGIDIDSERLTEVSGLNAIKRSYASEEGQNNEFTTAFKYVVSDQELAQIQREYNLNEIAELWLLPQKTFEEMIGQDPDLFSRSLKSIIKDTPDIYQKIKPSSLPVAINAYKESYDQIRAGTAGITEINEERLDKPRAFLDPAGRLKSREDRRKNGTFGVTEVFFLPESETRSRMVAFQRKLKELLGDKVYLVDTDKLHMTTQGLEKLAMHEGKDAIDFNAQPYLDVRNKAISIETSAVKMQVAGVNWNTDMGIFWELRPYLESQGDPVLQRRQQWGLGQPRPPHVTAAYFAQPLSTDDVKTLKKLIERYQDPDHFGDIDVNRLQVITYEDFSFNAGYRVLETVELKSSLPGAEQQGQGIASDEIRDTSEEVGGIDMNAIDLDRQGAGVDIQFDPAELQDIIDAGIDGFAPVIINITPLPSVLPLLGLDPANKEDPLEVSVL